MKKIVYIFSGIIFLLSTGYVLSEEQEYKKVVKLFNQLEKVIVQVSDQIKPAVVHIEVVNKADDIKYKSLASGLIIDEKGYILTNEHVVDKALTVTVTLPSKLEYPAEIIGVDKQTDLALIKIKTEEKLFVAKMGNSDKVSVGEWVIAVGNPYGFDRTVSFGIVSGKGRVLPNIRLETPLINDFIQTDAAIDPGSSGGPLVNLQGEVIGINSIGLGRGQGFTIPINMAKEVAAKLLASGTIERGWLGVAIQPLNRDYASYFGSSDLEGILVSDIEENSPAQQAGIKPGDIILKFKDTKVSAEKNEDLNPFKLLISQTSVGQVVPLKIFRDNKIADFTVKIGIQPKVKAEEFETGLGFTVKEITDQIFRQYMLESKEGVLVSYVEVGSPASTAELDGGDVIKKVENKSIKNLEDLKKILPEFKDSKRIMLTIKRGKSYRFVLILTEDSVKKQAQTEKL